MKNALKKTQFEHFAVCCIIFYTIFVLHILKKSSFQEDKIIILMFPFGILWSEAKPEDMLEVDQETASIITVGFTYILSAIFITFFILVLIHADTLQYRKQNGETRLHNK